MNDINIENNLELEEQVKILSNKMKALEDEVKDNWELFLRSRADAENLKKRTDKEIINITKYANKNLLLDLLPLIDSFEASISTFVDTSSGDNVYFLFYKMLLGICEKHGVRKIDIKEYDSFDPSKHEVVSTVDNDVYDNVISSVLQSGYQLHDHVLRYVKVSVYKKVF